MSARSAFAWTLRIRASCTRTLKTPSWSKIDSRILANARLSWSDQKDAWKVSFEVRNLTDEYYFQTKGDVTTSLGTVSGVPGLPRTYLVSVERKFN